MLIWRRGFGEGVTWVNWFGRFTLRTFHFLARARSAHLRGVVCAMSKANAPTRPVRRKE